MVRKVRKVRKTQDLLVTITYLHCDTMHKFLGTKKMPMSWVGKKESGSWSKTQTISPALRRSMKE